METHVKIIKKPRLKKPLLIVGLPGIGNVGRVAAGYLVNEMKMEKFAELYSQYFLPLVVMHDDSVAHILRCELYYIKRKKNDLVVLTGDTQSVSPEGHYVICQKILEFASQLGVKDIITIGGFAEGKVVDDPKVIGAVNDKSLVKKYEKSGIDFGVEHSVGTIVGASGLLIGMASLYGMNGLCLMGETVGLPMMTDPKSAEKVLEVLKKTISLDVDLKKLEKTIKVMEKKIQKTEEIHKQMLETVQKEDQIKYIG